MPTTASAILPLEAVAVTTDDSRKKTKLHTTFISTSIAACPESFFRSAMQSIFFQKVTNQPAPLFHNMHIQIPVRIIFLNGLKQIRVYTDTLDMNEYIPTKTTTEERSSTTSALANTCLVCLPGVAMTPFVAFLEASNAAKVNQTPLYLRWTQGTIPRLGREIICAIGINQVADRFISFFAHFVDHEFLRYCLGSVCAGWVAAYLSHTMHILATMKLSAPDRSYRQHWDTSWRRNIEEREKRYGINLARTICGTRAPSSSSKAYQRVAQLQALVCPLGYFHRAAQIGGGFMIVNGINHALKDVAEQYGWF